MSSLCFLAHFVSSRNGQGAITGFDNVELAAVHSQQAAEKAHLKKNVAA
jgi:hypothetical protein